MTEAPAPTPEEIKELEAELTLDIIDLAMDLE